MEPEPTPEFEALLEFVKNERGFDFTGYKRPSLLRRVGKRMESLGIRDVDEYRRHLESHDEEFAELFNTILINVTGFFRDAAAWEYLQAEVLPRLAQARQGEQIRVWSTGCATGEEAFTVAMLLAETVGVDAFYERVKIYATDVDDEALGEARHAVYPAKSLEAVPPEYRERYFERVDGRFALVPELRRAVIFGRHDLIQDPPISRIDLLVSRNTLMYFDSETQTRILAGFQFALNPDGYLFLGRSEMLLTRANLFTPVDLRRRVFARVPPRAASIEPAPRRPDPQRRGLDDPRDAAFELSPVAQLVVEAGGAVVGINRQARALFGLGRNDVGRPLQDLEISYRPVELRSRIDETFTGGQAVALRDVDWPAGNDARVLDLLVSPLAETDGTIAGASVAFTDVTRFRRLRDELDESRRQIQSSLEELQSTNEELETTNEELQSTNEELETTNEELHSTNEELETMNEEMQSTNEELQTMNDELRLRTDDLNDANAFLDSVLGGLRVGVAVVDAELRVEVWNEQAIELWGLRAEEALGSHVLNLDVGLPLAQLRDPLRKTLAGESVEPVVVEAVSRRGRTLRCRLTFASRRGGRGGEVRGAILLMEEHDGPAD